MFRCVQPFYHTSQPNLIATCPFQADHAAIIREVGAASAVLLKNTDRTLPFTGSYKKYSVFGTDAQANPAGINSCGFAPSPASSFTR